MHNMLLLSENMKYFVLINLYLFSRTEVYPHCFTVYILKIVLIWQWCHINNGNSKNIATMYLYLEIEDLAAVSTS